MNYELWINKVLVKLGALNKGQLFTLRELFSGIEWNELSTGQKRELGRRFKNEVINKRVPDVVLEKNENSGSTTYRKTS